MISTRMIFTDGGCAGADGHGAACYLIVKSDKIDLIECEYLDYPITNNIAEYCAIINALVWCKSKHWYDVEVSNLPIIISSDSQLVIRQMNGVYDVKSETLRPYYDLAQSLCQGMNITFQWIPRTNKYIHEADRYCDRAIKLRRNIHV